MEKFKYNPILISIIILGFLAAMFINYQRYNVEKVNNRVDLAISYDDVRFLAQEKGDTIFNTLKALKEEGISSISLDEINFKTLNETGEAYLLRGGDILKDYTLGNLKNPSLINLINKGLIDGNHLYVVVNDNSIFNDLYKELQFRLGENRVSLLKNDNTTLIKLATNYETIEEEGIGLNKSTMEEINKAGLYVMPRPSNYTLVTKEKIDYFFDKIKDVSISEIVFAGKQALGNPHEIRYMAEKMEEHNYTLGLIEAVSQLQFYKQNGAMELAKALDYKVARLYAIPKDEQPKLAMTTAINRWANTDEERNIRIDLLRAYEKPLEGKTVYETNIKYIKETKEILLSKGFTIGKADIFQAYYPSKYLQILVYFGIIAGLVLYLGLVFPYFDYKKSMILWGVLAIIGSGILIFSTGGKLRVLSALTAANFFPAISMIYILDCLRKKYLIGKSSYSYIVLEVIKYMAVAFVISMTGAMLLSGILSDITYFLEVNIFRGIKLTFVLPIILVALAFIKRFDLYEVNLLNPPSLLVQIKKVLDTKITLKMMAFLFAILVSGIIFVGRSGHTDGIPVPGIELKIRAFLENVFYARPRSKEIFIGHPAFMLMIMAWFRKWHIGVILFLTILATIGQGSMVETFAHMRSPIFMSFMRGFDGAIWGSVIGIVLISIISFITYKNSTRSKKINE